MNLPFVHSGSGPARFSSGPALILLLILANAACPSAVPAAVADYRESPVFFEIFADEYIRTKSSPDNQTLLPQGKLKIPPFETRELGDFTWHTGKSWNLSWAWRLQEFFYLLPLLQSGDEEHRQCAKDWFLKWHRAHRGINKPNHGAWVSMSTGIRAMVLVYFLKLEENREPADAPLIKTLRQSILEHRGFLSEGANFISNSNHGLWLAFALVEMTRVYPDAELEALGLRRLFGLTARILSSQGVEMEHSPAYHFAVARWLQDFDRYLGSMQALGWDKQADFNRLCRGMTASSYYLYDHHGNMPQIGDTDARQVDERFIIGDTDSLGPVLLDREAGLAVYKEPARSRWRRYLVFTIQSKIPAMPYHYHNDALSVYYNYDGEVILGDQGKYAYDKSKERSYFVSPAAHNLVMPAFFLEPKEALDDRIQVAAFFQAKKIWRRDGPGQLSMGAEMATTYRIDTTRPYTFFGESTPPEILTRDDQPGGNLRPGARIKPCRIRVDRSITLPENRPDLVVEDVVGAGSAAVLIWNIGPDVNYLERREPEGGRNKHRYEWRLRTRKGRAFRLTIDVDGPGKGGGHAAYLKRGETDPVFGWSSPKLMQKVPVSVIVLKVDDPDNVKLTTRLVKIEPTD